MRKGHKQEIKELKKYGLWSTREAILSNLHYFVVLVIVLLIWFIFEYESRHHVISYFWSRMI